MIVGLGVPSTAHLMCKIAPLTTVATAPTDDLRTWSGILNRDFIPRHWLGISGGAEIKKRRDIELD